MNQYESFQWLDESSISIEEDQVIIDAPALTDYFRDPAGSEPTQNAPFFYTQVTGDFVMKAKVTPHFESTYDACVLMVMADESHWCKACFERSDFGTNAVVSVVTNGLSDDCNGCNITGDTVWLQIVRKGQVFGLHYSEDGEHFYMMRVFTIPAGSTVKAGMLAQSPTGTGGKREFHSFSIEPVTVENIRSGI